MEENSEELKERNYNVGREGRRSTYSQQSALNQS